MNNKLGAFPKDHTKLQKVLSNFKVEFQVIISMDAQNKIVVQTSKPAPIEGITHLLLSVCMNNMQQLLNQKAMIIDPNSASNTELPNNDNVDDTTISKENDLVS